MFHGVNLLELQIELPNIEKQTRDDNVTGYHIYIYNMCDNICLIILLPMIIYDTI